MPEVLSSNDSVRLQAGAFLLVAGLAILGVRFYYAHTQIVPAVGGTLTEGVVGTPRSLNPILSPLNDADSDLTRLVFSRLYTTDGKGGIVPDLVDSTGVSADQKTYVLALKPGVRWHDGQPLSADDVVFTLALIQDPNWRSPLAAALKDVVAEKIDDRQVRFTLQQPYAHFLSQLTFGILPQHVWKDVTPAAAGQVEANLKPIGSGPFAYDSVKRDKRGFILSYSLKRNADYYAKAPFLQNVTFMFYPDDASAIDALRRREIDSLSFVANDKRPELSGLASVLPVSLELPQYTAVFFNPRQDDAIKDKDVRRALAMAVDKGRIIRDVFNGDGRPLDAPVPPGYTGGLENAASFDPEGAKRLLDGLGWKIDPADGVRKLTTTQEVKAQAPKVKGQRSKVKSTLTQTIIPLKIILTSLDQPEAMKVAKIVKDGWTAIGADVSISAVPASDIARTVIKPREYQALLYGQLLGADADPYLYWHSSQIQDPGLNLAMFANRDADAAIEAARKTTDSAVIQESDKKFLGVLAAQVPAVFLYSPSYTYALPAGLKGFGGIRVANPSDRFATVTDWYLKTKRAWK